MTKADRAWIRACIEDRKHTGKQSALRKYCVCMHAIVENNQPFRMTELERAYPPAHRTCRRKAGV